MSDNPIDEGVVESIAALLHEEATDEPWTVAGIEHDGPDRTYYRGLARKVINLIAEQQQAQGGGQVLGYVRRAAIQTLRADDEVTGVMVHIDPPTDSVTVYLAPPSAPVGADGQAVAVELTVCCGREECGGECGNPWRGMEWVRKQLDPESECDDAARYRFLRGDHGPTSSRWPRWKIEHWTGCWNPVQGSEMDAAIDAAMREAKP